MSHCQSDLLSGASAWQAPLLEVAGPGRISGSGRISGADEWWPFHLERTLVRYRP
jgi:hypothetical protein